MSAACEPILDKTNQQWCLYPIRHPDLFELYKNAVASFWTCEEVSLEKDRAHFETLDPKEQHFIKIVLAFFAASDALVNENLFQNFSTEVVYQESKLFYAFQSAIEGIHSEMYSLLIDTLISDPREKDRLFNAITTIPVVQKKAAWVTKWMEPDTNAFGRRLIAFAAAEGIMFSASFCAVYWLKKRGIMPGLCFSNELISKDEALHRDHAVMLHHKLQQPASESDIHEIIGEAVAVETQFVQEALASNLLGINSGEMQQYVHFVADQLLLDLGVSKLYDATNPFDWMVNLGLQGHTNFFEARNSQYNKAGVGADGDEKEFSTDCDF